MLDIKFTKEKPNQTGLYLLRKDKSSCPILCWIWPDFNLIMPVERRLPPPTRFDLNTSDEFEFALIGIEANAGELSSVGELSEGEIKDG